MFHQHEFGTAFKQEGHVRLLPDKPCAVLARALSPILCFSGWNWGTWRRGRNQDD